jgi:hypothetical protein
MTTTSRVTGTRMDTCNASKAERPTIPSQALRPETTQVPLPLPGYELQLRVLILIREFTGNDMTPARFLRSLHLAGAVYVVPSPPTSRLGLMMAFADPWVSG